MEERKERKGTESGETQCAECGAELKEGDKACPSCGSTKKIHHGRASCKGIGSLRASATVLTHMSPQSWTIFALIVAFFIPPTYYAVFSILTICFWYKVLIWLGIMILAYFLTRFYRFIRLLIYLADRAYGKH